MSLIMALFSGVATAYAYAILSGGGFSPIPAKLVPYKGFSSAINSAITSACSAWNGAGQGTLLTRSTSTHTNNSQFPLKNGANQISSLNAGVNHDVMSTRVVNTKTIGDLIYNTEVDININTAYPWATTGDSKAYDFQNCFTHELGHLLGLDDEQYKSDSTMYSVFKLGETQKRTLTQDDKNGIAVIY